MYTIFLNCLSNFLLRCLKKRLQISILKGFIQFFEHLLKYIYKSINEYLYLCLLKNSVAGFFESKDSLSGYIKHV